MCQKRVCSAHKPAWIKVTLQQQNIAMYTGFDSVHTSHIKNSKRCYRKLLCKFYKKLISQTHIPHSMLKGHIRPTVKNSSGNETD